MNLSDVFLIVAVVCAAIEAVMSKSLLAAAVAFFAAAFLVNALK